MDVFEERICRRIRENRLIAPGSTVIAGVSGGADSVCLLRVLAALRENLQFTIFVVHVEHGLRGQSALEDAEFVRLLCGGLGVACCTEHINVGQMAREEGLSLEEAGRKARYECFEKYRILKKADVIAVAHHAGDQAETVLLNLCRGSGVRGLGGMRMRSGFLIRPLLEEKREEIEAYLARCGQEWRTDETNAQDLFSRNRIRGRILPELMQINPRSVEHICQAASFAQRAEDYLQRQAAAALEEIAICEDGRVSVDEAGLQEKDPLLREYILRDALRYVKQGNGLKDIGAVHVQILEKLTRSASGARADLPGGIIALRTGGKLCLFAGGAQGGEEETPKLLMRLAGENFVNEIALSEASLREGICVEACGVYGFGDETIRIRACGQAQVETIEEKKYTKWLSYDTMKDTLCLRTRRPGDYLVVNAGGGKKKLKDYLIDQKVPAGLRSNVLLLAQGSHILWAVGLRISEAAKVCAGPAQPKGVLCIRAGILSEENNS